MADPFFFFFEASLGLVFTMATSGGGNYRNGTHKSSMKVDRSLSLNSNPKPSVKSKSLPSSGPRRNSTGSLAGGAAKDNAGGEFCGFYFIGS